MNVRSAIRFILWPLLFCCIAVPQCHSQTIKKAANWLIYHSVIDTVPPGKPSFRIYPTVAYSPETSVELGISSLYIFQAKGDTLNRLSELTGFAFVTLESQYGLWIDNAIYTHQDKWFILGRNRFQRFPLLYYGVGPHTSAQHPAVVDAGYLMLRQRVLRKVVPNLFIGPEVDYQYLFRTNIKYEEDDPIREVPKGSQGSGNLGLGGAVVYDNRHNVLNVRKGLFAEIGFLSYARAVASDYSFSGVNVDIRSYHPMGKNVLAWQVVGNFYNGEVPFNQMALMGGETMMRGYYYGRYRDKTMVAGQAEYRLLPLPFSKRIGAAFFGGAAAVAPAVGKLSTSGIKLAGGAGIRYLLFPKKDIFVRLDVGFTREGFGFYFFTGEAF